MAAQFGVATDTLDAGRDPRPCGDDFDRGDEAVAEVHRRHHAGAADGVRPQTRAAASATWPGERPWAGPRRSPSTSSDTRLGSGPTGGRVHVVCSSSTYVRTLADDIDRAWPVTPTSPLRRTGWARSAVYAVTVDGLDAWKDHLISPADASPTSRHHRRGDRLGRAPRRAAPRRPPGPGLPTAPAGPRPAAAGHLRAQGARRSVVVLVMKVWSGHPDTWSPPGQSR